MTGSVVHDGSSDDSDDDCHYGYLVTDNCECLANLLADVENLGEATRAAQSKQCQVHTCQFRPIKSYCACSAGCVVETVGLCSACHPELYVRGAGYITDLPMAIEFHDKLQQLCNTSPASSLHVNQTAWRLEPSLLQATLPGAECNENTR